MKNYLLICEIGPIYDFVRHSRKTVDFWGASFLFSYVMSEVARDIKNNGGNIFLPYLGNNPMFLRNGKITCGSVPDQIYATFTDTHRGNIEAQLKTIIEKPVNDATLKTIEGAVQHKERFTEAFNHNEIKDFFNFFYITHVINDTLPDYNEFIEAERKIRMRSAIRPFRQITGNKSIAKWEKCSLCGDRKRIYSIVVDKIEDAGFYHKEHICSVCLLKRFLPEAVKSIFSDPRVEFIEPYYQSTSDIALSPIKECINKSGDEIKREYQALIKKCEQESVEKHSEGRFFYDQKHRKKFTAWKKSLTEKYPDKVKLSWLERPFYSIVYMDGDNMGQVLREKKDDFQPYIKKISELLSVFSNKTNDIISGTEYGGQLIFAGGEDVNFVIHPEYLLGCIHELQKAYNNLFKGETLTEPIAEKLTLSAGVVVCYHKYPLSEAIHRAGVMLKDHAKNYKGKNATAISLIKGHTEALQFTISNNSLVHLKELKECLVQSDISRTTPHRIAEYKELFDLITDDGLRRNYLQTIIAGTRNPEKNKNDIEKVVNCLMRFDDSEAMINALLFARFLTGDRPCRII